MKDSKDFEVGQRVKSKVFGKGTIVSIYLNLMYPVAVKYDCHFYFQYYTRDGRYYQLEGEDIPGEIEQHSIEII